MPLIVAHRGASADAPENTIAAVRLAWEQGADAVEVDVHLTSDGRIVCIHDESTKRTTGEDLLVRQSRWEHLAVLDAGSWKGRAFAGERIPLLDEVLDALPADRALFVEIKADRAIVGPLGKLLADHPAAARTTIISFDVDVLEAMGRVLPQVPRVWILDAERESRLGSWIAVEPRVAAQARAWGFAGIDMRHEGVSVELVEACRSEGVALHVWTVDDEARARRLAAMGVASLTTNRPGALRIALAGE